MQNADTINNMLPWYGFKELSLRAFWRPSLMTGRATFYLDNEVALETTVVKKLQHHLVLKYMQELN